MSLVALAALVLGTGTVLGGCADSHAASLAHQACGYVARAERLQREAGAARSPTSRLLVIRAERQLELAEPLAAIAAGDDPSWQALQANLGEVHRLPTALILPALRADCAAAGG
ncbi:MAG: hypothetical protein ACYCSF_02700 [Acidimicrobiales bacterium]